MKPHYQSNQKPAATSAVQQVNPVTNQQMFNANANAGGLFPNNMPVAAPPFMNFPNQPFPLQNATAQFPNGIPGFNPQQNFIPFPVNQFNPSQQPQGQFFAHNSMNPTVYPQSVGGQALLQNTIQNIYQLLQLQNPNYTQCPPGNFPMFQNQIANGMNTQNPGFPVSQQVGISSSNVPQNMGQQLQGNPFLPGASGSVQTQQPQNPQATPASFQNQIPQGVGPQNQNLFTNQMFGMANLNNPMQNVNQGQPGFVSPMMDVNASRPMVNAGQTHNPSPPLTNFEGNYKSNANGGWSESQRKNFTGHKTNDASQMRSKFNKHGKEKFGIYNRNMGKEGGNNLTMDPFSQNSTNFEKKVPSLNYTEQEIKEWREARKKNYPTKGTVSKEHSKEKTSSDDATNQEAILRRQQLKDILAKQAELGCEVAEIPRSYLSGSDKQNPRERKHERHQKHKKGKFHKKRGTSFQDVDRIAKKSKANKRELSLLQKLLTQDIKRDKKHLLQVLRFITANSFFTEESLRFPSVIVRDTNVDVSAAQKTTTSSVMKVAEEEEGEIID